MQSDSLSKQVLLKELASSDADEGEKVILALKHRDLPLWGVQFHPESIESDQGERMLGNWLSAASKLVAQWDGERGTESIPSWLRKEGRSCVASALPPSRPLSSAGTNTDAKTIPQRSWRLHAETLATSETPGAEQVEEVFERLFLSSAPQGIEGLWLDSARKMDPHSRFSYMALPDFWLSYRVSSASAAAEAGAESSGRLTITRPGAKAQTINLGQDETWWSVVQDLQRDLARHTRGVASGADELHMFKGGLVGYFGYGMRAETIARFDTTSASSSSSCNSSTWKEPDSELAMCSRVLALDHHTGAWTVFALVQDDHEDVLPNAPSTSASMLLAEPMGLSSKDAQAWLAQLKEQLRQIKSGEGSTSSNFARRTLPPMTCDDAASQYLDKVRVCRAHIAAGESYELCLTTQFRGKLPSSPATRSLEECSMNPHRFAQYELYKGLRAHNAAPYSAFLQLPLLEGRSNAPRAICSTSPERFMRATASGILEMKPIKGTVARAGFAPGEEKWREGSGGCESQACQDEEARKRAWREGEDEKRRDSLAADVKERAENLMVRKVE